MSVHCRLQYLISSAAHHRKVFHTQYSIRCKPNHYTQTLKQCRLLNTPNGPSTLSGTSVTGTYLCIQLSRLTMSTNIATLRAELDETLNSNIALAERFKTHVLEHLDVTNPADNIDSSKQMNMKLYWQLKATAENIANLLEEMQELNEILQSPESNREIELVEMAGQDLRSSSITLKEYLQDAAAFLLPDHAFDAKSAVLEVQAGAGGNEASLFAEEIFNLYVGLSKVNFNVEISSVERHQGGDGIDKATVVVNGLGAFRFLKYECGVHRVQRVPKASTGNKSDRLQTSTCSVAVLPLPDDADYHVPECELKVEFVKSSGPGGQNVNKLETACRVTHLPSGLSVKCQEHRTQLKNKEIAIQQVTSKLYQQNYEEQMKHTIAFRKSQIGNMNRNEKIRSYHFTRNQVTDHRIEKGTRQVPDIAALFSGKLGYDIIRELREKIAWEHQTKSLDEYLASY